jgi:ABC-type transport system substrate-binding protein
MEERSGLSRRNFLRLSAVAAGGAALAACGTEQQGGAEGRKDAVGGVAGGRDARGSVTDPLPTPPGLKEAPMLERMVDAGELPPLEERLPENPYVVPHKWLTPGKYGGNLRLTIDSTESAVMKEYMYGHSPLRWLNDAQDVGPGLAESWESNDDASEWTLRFRKGLKWSDGEPWSTEDIMFWWEDMVLNEAHPEVPPDDARSGTGTVMEMSAPDDLTIVMNFDAPAPLTSFYLANWVKAGVGPTWMAPKHYLKQFHAGYNADAGEDWADTFEQKRNFAINPECPTMTGWRLKTYKEGRNLVWERNPYYWCVGQDGAQLPYIDTLTVEAVQDPEVMKLQIQQGEVDYVHGTFASLTLSDVSALKQTGSRSGLEVLFWDSGSGTGSLFFFNFNYREPKMRALINEPRFRQALSHAVDRDEAQRSIFYNTGYKTTGSYSPKASDFIVNAEGRRMFEQWRDSYVDYDPEKAKALLDEIGVVDRDGDGNREMPDGSELTVRLDHVADLPEDGDHIANLFRRNWEEIGLSVQRNPVPPAAWSVKWVAGELMTYTAWLYPAMPVHECMVSPELMVPVGNGLSAAFWAPLYANYHAIRNTPKEKEVEDTDPYERNPPSMKPEEGGAIDRLWKLYDKARVETDAMKRYELVWEMVEIHASEGPFYMGVVGNYPVAELAHEDMRNVPRGENLALGGLVNPWHHPTPAAYDPEAYYWSNPQEHEG